MASHSSVEQGRRWPFPLFSPNCGQTWKHLSHFGGKAREHGSFSHMLLSHCGCPQHWKMGHPWYIKAQAASKPWLLITRLNLPSASLFNAGHGSHAWMLFSCEAERLYLQTLKLFCFFHFFHENIIFSASGYLTSYYLLSVQWGYNPRRVKSSLAVRNSSGKPAKCSRKKAQNKCKRCHCDKQWLCF